MGSGTKTQVINICREKLEGFTNSGTKTQATPV